MHAQLIRERRLVFHAAELPGGTGCARQRNLQVDEYTGKALTIVQFDTEWKRLAGFNHRDFEWLVIEGKITVGDTECGPLDYIFMPGGARLPIMVAAAGTRAVVRRRSSWFFEESDWQQPWAKDSLTIRAHSGLSWDAHSNVAVLRESSGDQTLLMKADSSVEKEWPKGTESAILLDGRVHVGEESFPAPIALIGTSLDDPVPPVSSGTKPTWLIFTSPSPDSP